MSFLGFGYLLICNPLTSGLDWGQMSLLWLTPYSILLYLTLTYQVSVSPRLSQPKAGTRQLEQLPQSPLESFKPVVFSDHLCLPVENLKRLRSVPSPCSFQHPREPGAAFCHSTGHTSGFQTVESHTRVLSWWLWLRSVIIQWPYKQRPSTNQPMAQILSNEEW